MLLSIDSPVIRKTAYHVRRLDWVWRWPFVAKSDMAPDRPIFLLGNQGGGNTFLSRVIRRHPDVVSATGNCDYWTGADEMQRVFEPVLPAPLRLAGRLTRSDPPHPDYSMPRSWSYGTDDLVDAYHVTEADVTPEAREKFCRVIQFCAERYGQSARPRFFDKSQVFTLKTRFVQACLSETTPYFVLMTRDPVVSCYRAAAGKAGDMARYTHLSMEAKVRACAEHWDNCMRRAMNDSHYLRRFIQVRFEDLLSDYRAVVRKVCDFVELDFQERMLPSPDDVIPFATRYLDRWWPVRMDVNRKYEIPEVYGRIITERCAETARALGYDY